METLFLPEGFCFIITIMRKIPAILLVVPFGFMTFGVPGTAQAQIDDPYYENFFGDDLNDSLDSQAEIAQGNVEINRILKVLRQKPDAASKSCLQALKALHQARKQLKKATDDATDEESKSNFELAKDIFGSSVMDVSTMCGADAHTLCRGHQYESAGLTQSCPLLQEEPDEGL